MGQFFVLQFFPELQGMHQSFIASRLEQVHAVQVTERGRHLTIFEAYGNNEDPPILQQFGFLEGDLQFLMPVSRLLVESPRETDKDQVPVQDRLADLMLPVLPGLKVLGIQPGIDAIPDQALVKFADRFLIPMGINKENIHLPY